MKALNTLFSTRLAFLICAGSFCMCAAANNADKSDAPASGGPGPMEKTGQALDRAAKKTGAAVKRAAEKTGEALENAGEHVGKAARKTGEAVGRGVERTGQALERTGQKVQQKMRSSDAAEDDDRKMPGPRQ